jgi:hypothetical protein
MRASAHHLRRSKHRAPGFGRGGEWKWEEWPAGGPEVVFSSVDLRRFQDAVIRQVDSLAFVSQGAQLQEAPPACGSVRYRIGSRLGFLARPNLLSTSPSSIDCNTSQGCVFMIINNLLLSRTVIPFLLRTATRISISSRPLQSSKMSSLSEVSGKAAGAFEQTKAAFEFISFVNDSPTRE